MPRRLFCGCCTGTAPSASAARGPRRQVLGDPQEPSRVEVVDVGADAARFGRRNRHESVTGVGAERALDAAALQGDHLVAVGVEDLHAVVADAAVVGAAVLPHHDPVVGRTEGQQVGLFAGAGVERVLLAGLEWRSTCTPPLSPLLESVHTISGR